MPLTPRQLRRRKALAKVPPPGFRVCRLCLCTRADAAFLTSLGNHATRCAKCRARAAPRLARHMREYRKSPGGKMAVYALHANFIDARPHHEHLYRFRYRLDTAWATGNRAVQKYLAGLGYHPGDACVTCGAKKPLAFWLDYTRPWSWQRLCARHRRAQAVQETRTVAEINAQLASVRDRMAEVYAVIHPYLPKGA